MKNTIFLISYASALRLVFLWCCMEHMPKECVQSSLRSFLLLISEAFYELFLSSLRSAFTNT